jgi:sugar phosphate isomerase/epimerase
MSSSDLTDLSRLAVHTQTIKSWPLQQCIAEFGRAGIRGISVWRHTLEPMGARTAGKMLRDAGMRVPALVRGGFFVGHDAKARQAAIDVNRTCIDEAAAIAAETVVLVVGAVPGIALQDARKQVAEGIANLLDHAAASNVKLAIEPMHPMYAADRSCINRIVEARHICEQLKHPMLGIALDVYHTWWDPDLSREIALAGEQGTLIGFHVCDWRVETRHLLNDRGLMGDGCIPIRTIRGWVEAAGFQGFNEVEVFSDEYWAMDPIAYVDKIRSAYLHHT